MNDVRCLDAGGGVCPCVLADGGCPVCPPLLGGECACDWNGVCVLEVAGSGRRSERRPRLLARVRGVTALRRDRSIVHVDWPAAALPRGIAFCLVMGAGGEQAAPVLGVTDSAETAIAILMQGKVPAPEDTLELRGPFAPN